VECIVHFADCFLQIGKDGKTAGGFCSAARSHFRKIAQTSVGNPKSRSWEFKARVKPANFPG
jgi:hypothetical protein